MARAYTAWVLQKGDGTMLRLDGGTVAIDTKRVTEAFQMARKVDAQRLAARLILGAEWKATEKTIG